MSSTNTLKPSLITGGAGFIGAALARRMRAEGRPVLLLDVAPFDRLADLSEGEGIERIVGDVRDEALVNDLVRRSGRVIHLAAVVGVDDYLRRPLEVLDVNILGSRNVLFAAQRAKVPVLLASTSEIYGKTPGPLSEGADRQYGDAGNARWTYGLSKSAAESYARSLVREGLKVRIVRYFNVYGPGLDRPGEGRVIAKFVGRLLKGEPLVLVDGGRAKRSFCYIDDAVEATLRLIDALDDPGPENGQAYNVGRLEPVAMRRLAEMMLALSGSSAGMIERPGSSAFGEGFEEIHSREPDFSAFAARFGFHAGTDLRSGLARTLDHYGLLRHPPGTDSAPPLEPIPWVRPLLPRSPELRAEIDTALETGVVTNQGPVLTAFEAELSAYLGASEGAAVSSGAAALSLGLMAFPFRPGRVILPAFTYLATLSAVHHAGYAPLFADLDPRTYTLDPESCASLLGRFDDVRGILAVNVFGVPPDLPALKALADRRGIPLWLDNAHGLGTRFGEELHPAEPDLIAYSLHATKTLPTGEGGFLLCADPVRLEEIRRLRTHGLAPDPLDSRPGFNAKLSEFHAAVGRHALRDLPRALARRRAHFHRLRAALAGCDGFYTLQAIPPRVETNAQNLTAELDLSPARGGIEEIMAAFQARGIGVRRYFWPPLHRLRFLDDPPHLPRTDRLVSRLISLPLYAGMSETDLERIEAAVREVAAQWRS